MSSRNSSGNIVNNNCQNIRCDHDDQGSWHINNSEDDYCDSDRNEDLCYLRRGYLYRHIQCHLSQRLC